MALNGQGWLKPVSIVIAAGSVLTMAVLPLVPGPPGNGDLPEFPAGDTDARKKAFIEYLRPVIEHRNARIAREREWLLDATAAESWGWLDRWRMQRLARRYRVDMETLPEDEAFAVLMRRVDTVPASLALVQAARESGWGRSRFAREGNALYGERCFEAGCGMVPDARAAGSTFEVQAFATVGDAVDSYLRNLNSHERYIGLRMARQDLRKQGRRVTGTALAEYLESYSVRRDAYVQALQAMIRQNNLESE